MSFNKQEFTRYPTNYPTYLDSQEANVTVFTRARLMQDETRQILLERMFQLDENRKTNPNNLRTQFALWMKSPAPLIIINLAPLCSSIIGTNYTLLEDDLGELIVWLSKRRGDIRILSSGSDELTKKVAAILANCRAQKPELIKMESYEQ
jgi:hypothetical protein